MPCTGPQTIAFRTRNVGNININPVLGGGATHFTLRFPDNSIQVFGPAPPTVALVAVPQGLYCGWPSDGAGNAVGTIITMIPFGATKMKAVTLSGLVTATRIDLGISGERIEDIDLTGLTILDRLKASDVRLEMVLGIPDTILSTLDLSNNELPSTEVDNILNALNPLNGPGTVDLGGGTNGAPTAASFAARTALTTAGWTVTTN